MVKTILNRNWDRSQTKLIFFLISRIMQTCTYFHLGNPPNMSSVLRTHRPTGILLYMGLKLYSKSIPVKPEKRIVRVYCFYYHTQKIHIFNVLYRIRK